MYSSLTAQALHSPPNLPEIERRQERPLLAHTLLHNMLKLPLQIRTHYHPRSQQPRQ